MFRKISIRNMFILLIVMAVTLFSSMGAYFLNVIKETEEIARTIHNHPLVVSNAAQKANDGIIKIHLHLHEMYIRKNPEDISLLNEKIKILKNEMLNEIASIKTNILGEEGKILAERAEMKYLEFLPLEEQIVSEFREGNFEQGLSLIIISEETFFKEMENDFAAINSYARNKSNFFIASIEQKMRDTYRTFYILVIAAAVSAALLMLIVYRGIKNEIEKISDFKKKIIKTGEYKRSDIPVKQEFSELVQLFNIVLEKIRMQIDTANKLQQIQNNMAVDRTPEEVLGTYLDYTVNACGLNMGVAYRITEENKLVMAAKYAYYSTAEILREFSFNEGLVGQCAANRQPVYMENIVSEEIIIKSATKNIMPDSIYIMPVLYDKRLLCVVEFAARGTMDAETIDFLEKSGEALASYYETTSYYEKNSILFDETKMLNETLKTRNAQIEIVNEELKKKQAEIEQNARELEAANAELERNANELESLNMELEKNSRKLTEKNIELDRSNKHISQFLANVSHELRTPLNSIILLSDMMSKEKEVSKDYLERIEVINSAGEELLGLINNLLDISKIESGKMEVISEEISSGELCERMKRKYMHLAENKKIGFEVKDSLNDSFVSDRQKIIQITNNLLSNAMKFTSKGKVVFEIGKSVLKEYDAQISVTDTGIGISEDKQKHIFDEFTQGDGSITRKFGGTGLGLSIVRRFTEIIDGKLEIESKEGSGSRFTVHIKNIDSSAAGRVMKTALNINPEILPADGKTLLLIEDDLEYAEKIKKFADEKGFRLIIAPEGKQGIRLAEQVNPDGIILDLMLPDIFGGKVLRELKYNPATREIPVHILTVKDEGQLDCLSMGAIGYTRKTPDTKSDVNEVMANIEKFNGKKPKSLLIVEDEKLERDMIISMLADWDVEIETSAGIKNAVRKIEKKDFDAMVIDLGLEDGNGLDLCKYVREKGIRIPIIIYTGKSVSEKEANILKKYSDSIVLKDAVTKGQLMEELSLFLHKVSGKTTQIKHDTKIEKDDFHGKKILICDDDPKNIFSLSTILEEFGIEILEAFNGKEALEVLEDNTDVDLIIMDIMMPVMDGLEAISRIRQTTQISKIPIIAVTAKAMKEDRENCMKAGADDYLSKPVDIDMLIKLIHIWITRE